MPPQFICPSCEELLDSFSYTLDTVGYESGSASIPRTGITQVQSINFLDLDCDYSETTDSENLQISCPECGEIITDELSTFLNDNYEPNPTTTKKIESKPISDSARIIRKTEYPISVPGQNRDITTCTNCAYNYIANNNDDCPHCGQPITKE
jgi:predicted RNA-binding Zn-ribbon protein involved in translation (DUF1610 family)